MNITVNVADVDLDSEIGRHHAVQVAEDEWRDEPMTLRDAVVSEIARQALARETREGWQPLSAEIKNVRADLLRELLRPALAEALTKPLTPTDAFGQPKGETTTLTEIITRQFRELLAERVDSRGSVDRYSRDKGWTRLEWMIRTSVEAVVKDELAGEITAAREELRATLQQVAAAKLAETVKV